MLVQKVMYLAAGAILGAVATAAAYMLVFAEDDGAIAVATSTPTASPSRTPESSRTPSATVTRTATEPTATPSTVVSAFRPGQTVLLTNGTGACLQTYLHATFTSKKLVCEDDLTVRTLADGPFVAEDPAGSFVWWGLDGGAFIIERWISDRLIIFDDELNPTWTDGSWDAVADFAVASQAHSGDVSLSLSVTAAWGALHLVPEDPVDTGRYSALTFAARASDEGARYSVWVVDATGARVGLAASLADYGGEPEPGEWRVYTIPLDPAHLATTERPISGVIIQDNTAGPQPELFVDDLGFIVRSP